MPTVSSTSRGGMQPNEDPVMKSGVTTAWFHWMGVGRSTRTPRRSSSVTRLSSSAFAFSTVSSGRGPHIPRMSLSSGIFASVAGSDGGMQVKSARPTMTCSSGSKSFHELTTVLLIPAVPPVESMPVELHAPVDGSRECARKLRNVNTPRSQGHFTLWLRPWVALGRSDWRSVIRLERLGPAVREHALQHAPDQPEGDGASRSPGAAPPRRCGRGLGSLRYALNGRTRAKVGKLR